MSVTEETEQTSAEKAKELIDDSDAFVIFTAEQTGDDSGSFSKVGERSGDLKIDVALVEYVNDHAEEHDIHQ